MKNATSFSSWPRCLLTLLGLLGLCTGTFAASPRPPALLAGPTPVGNYVFLDANQNNVFDAAENGIPSVRVCLYTSDGVLRETATTTPTGLFSFTTTIQPNTSYDIRIKAADAPANRRLVVARQGGDPTADSDATLVGNTAVIVVQSTPTGTLPTALGFGYAAGDPDLILTKTSDSFSVARGGTATFTLSVSNVGGSTATGVIVRDTLDTGMGYVSSSPAATTALLGSGKVQVTWNTGTLSASASATYTLTVSALADGVLTNTAGVTATSADGTPRNNLASASFSVPAKLCQGGAYVTSLAPNLTNVEWFRAGASVGTGNSLTIVTSGAYSYTAFAVGSDCQVSSCSPLIIYDGAVPNLTLASSASAICAGQSSVLSVSNCTGTVLWNTGATTTSITVSPTVTTGYSATCTPTAADACPSSVSATVTVNPSVTATLSSATICNGLVATITATGGTSYTLSDGQVNTTGIFSVSPALTTAYSVTVANSSGCTSLASGTVTVNPSVTATL
ncbi:SdrD B-like domain-containing protein, partial [Fibrella aquatilis]